MRDTDHRKWIKLSHFIENLENDLGQDPKHDFTSKEKMGITQEEQKNTQICFLPNKWKLTELFLLHLT